MNLAARLSRIGAIGGVFALFLTLGGGRPAEGAFPGANGWIAFVSDRAFTAGDIYVMRVGGAAPRRVTSGGYALQPAWSPDGTKIAFSAVRPPQRSFGIYVTSIGGTERQLSGGDDQAPAWSPDGSKIVFGSRRTGSGDVWIMNADGSGETRLTSDPAAEGAPAWSPDGRRIAFGSAKHGNPDVVVINADGSGERRLTDAPASDGMPAWSPDARHIAFASERDGNREIYVMNADGTGQRRLTRNAAVDSNPAWSPDGKWIAFDRVANPDREGPDVWLMRADGRAQRRLEEDWNQGTHEHPDWQPAVDLVVVASPRRPQIRVGRTSRYTLTVKNRSQLRATEVTLTHVIRGAVTVRSVRAARGTCAGSKRSTCELGELAPLASKSVRIAVKPLRPGRTTHRSVVKLREPEANGRDNVVAALLRVSS